MGSSHPTIKAVYVSPPLRVYTIDTGEGVIELYVDKRHIIHDATLFTGGRYEVYDMEKAHAILPVVLDHVARQEAAAQAASATTSTTPTTA